MGRWSDIPVELLELVEESLVLYADKLRIRAVCLYWYDQLPKLPNRQFPWLLQPVDNNDEASHALFNPINQKFYFLDSPDLLQGKIFKGSAFGWVVTLEDVYDVRNSNRIYLVNPLTSARIELPSRDKFPDVMKYEPCQVDKEYSVFSVKEGDHRYFFFNSVKEITDDRTSKFIVSCDPCSNSKECVVVVIYDRRLACCTLSDTRWNPLPVERECEPFEDIISGRDIPDAIQATSLCDIIFSKGKLHALLYDVRKSQVVVFENIYNGSKPKITLIANRIRDDSDPTTKPVNVENSNLIIREYLVESSDGSCLMIVVRYIRFTEINKQFDTPDTCYFKVYRVDPANRRCVELKSIGDDILIIGLNTSKSISSRNCIGYKRNHVYFTDHEFTFIRENIIQEDNDIGVFNLEDNTLQPLCGFKANPKFLWPPPIWV